MKSPIKRSNANATKEANTPIMRAKAEIGKTRVVVVKSPSKSQDRFGLCAAPISVAMPIVYRRTIYYEEVRIDGQTQTPPILLNIAFAKVDFLPPVRLSWQR